MDLTNKNIVKKLIKSCLRGKATSQNDLFMSVYGKMSGLCMRYAENTDEAKDIFQTGMLRVFDNLEKYNFKGSFLGWIRRIIVNNAIDYIRKKKYIFNEFEDNNIYENIDEKYLIQQDEDDLPKISAEKIIELVQELSPAYRTVFNLYVIEDYTHKQISEKLNISVGTSKSNLSKAKLKLKKILNQELVKIEK